MKKCVKLLSLILALLLCVLSLSACSLKGFSGKTDDNDVSMEDGEDSGVKQAKVTIANITGKDAVKVVSRLSSSKDKKWSDNILSQDYLHNEKAVEITYVVGSDMVYDLRLEFGDGTHQDFLNLDFGNAQSIIYLRAEESSTAA